MPLPSGFLDGEGKAVLEVLHGVRRVHALAAIAALMVAVLVALAMHPARSESSHRPPLVVSRPALVTHKVTVDGMRVRSATYTLREPRDRYWMWPGHQADAQVSQGSDGVPVYRADDGHTYPHPVAAEIYGLTAASAHNLPEELAAGRNLLGQSVKADGALWFPYRFDFALYGDASETLRAPWYSALAQGQALSLFVSLYQATHDAKWRAAADATFLSFRTNTHRIVQRDGASYLWMEEYPHGRSGEQVFNGHVTALTGLLDYWHLTGKGRPFVEAALTTAQRYVATIRNPGAVSSYSLRNPGDRNPGYHEIHIEQLHALAAVTGLRYFERMADAFAADA